MELKIQEYGAYIATTVAGKFEGLAMGPFTIAWEPDTVLYGPYAPDHPRNAGHVNDPKLTAMLKEQRRTGEWPSIPGHMGLHNWEYVTRAR